MCTCRWLCTGVIIQAALFDTLLNNGVIQKGVGWYFFEDFEDSE